MEYRVSHERGCTVVRPSGVLATDTYAEFRDHLVKLAVDEPKAVVVDLADLRFDRGSLLSVFVAVWVRTCEWPAVPVVLAASPAALPAGTGLHRFVQVHPTVDEAVTRVGRPPPRERAHRTLPPDVTSPALARAFTREACDAWGVPDRVAENAVLVASELVTNSVTHGGSEARVRLELRRGTLTVAVSDDDPTAAVLRDPGAKRPGGLGLLMVAQVARAWGCVCDPDSTGKVVWAVLRTA